MAVGYQLQIRSVTLAEVSLTAIGSQIDPVVAILSVLHYLRFYEAIYRMDVKGVRIRNHNTRLGDPDIPIDCVKFKIMVSLPF